MSVRQIISIIAEYNRVHLLYSLWRRIIRLYMQKITEIEAAIDNLLLQMSIAWLSLCSVLSEDTDKEQAFSQWGMKSLVPDH